MALRLPAACLKPLLASLAKEEVERRLLSAVHRSFAEEEAATVEEKGIRWRRHIVFTAER